MLFCCAKLLHPKTAGRIEKRLSAPTLQGQAEQIGADILVDGEKIGVMGEFYPEVIRNFGLGQHVIGFEIDIKDQGLGFEV